MTIIEAARPGGFVIPQGVCTYSFFKSDTNCAKEKKVELSFVSANREKSEKRGTQGGSIPLQSGINARIIACLPPRMREAVQTLLAENPDTEELRIRVGRPVQAVLSEMRETILFEDAPLMREEAAELLTNICADSVYAREDELKEGYIALGGGVRVGVCGAPAIFEGRITSLTDVASFNFRFPREVKGCAERFLRRCFYGKQPFSFIIAAPPREGKTTFLRDCARCLSNGSGVDRAYKVAVVDERNELSGGIDGGLDIGMRTDLMCGVPKTVGIPMLVRSMSPDIIITDELSGNEEMHAVYEAGKLGAAVLASVHAGSIDDVMKKPWLRRAVEEGALRAFFMKRTGGKQTIFDAGNGGANRAAIIC